MYSLTWYFLSESCSILSKLSTIPWSLLSSDDELLIWSQSSWERKEKKKFVSKWDNRVPPPSLLLYFILLFVSPSLSFTGLYPGFIVWGRSPEWPKATSFLRWSRGMPLPKIFEMNMCWDAIWCILRHNFEKYYSVCSELQWRFSYLIL